MLTIQDVMTTSPVIPVIILEDIDHAVPLARALVAGGLRVLEITLRTAAALESIARMKQAVPEAIVGAGTVLSPEDIARSADAGADFLVSPGSTPALVEAALQCRLPFLPGVISPSEAMGLLERGISHMKFFPAGAAGGVNMLKSIRGPLPRVRFCPTGGITADNARDYLALDNVLCVGGSWMVNQGAMAAGDWAAIEAGAKAASQLAAPAGE